MVVEQFCNAFGKFFTRMHALYRGQPGQRGQRALSTTQVQTWVVDQMNREGFGQRQHGQHSVQFTCRYIGQPAASGRRQMVFTMWDYPSAMIIFNVMYRWWSKVPPNVDPRGWRWVSVRWYR